jgi:hypothetical protein
MSSRIEHQPNPTSESKSDVKVEHRKDVFRLLTAFLPSLLTYSITPWRMTLFEKLIVTQLVKKVSCFLYGTGRFITVFTKDRHWILSWASRIQFATSTKINIPKSIKSFIIFLTLPVVFLYKTRHFVKWVCFHISVECIWKVDKMSGSGAHPASYPMGTRGSLTGGKAAGSWS